MAPWQQVLLSVTFNFFLPFSQIAVVFRLGKHFVFSSYCAGENNNNNEFLYLFLNVSELKNTEFWVWNQISCTNLDDYNLRFIFWIPNNPFINLWVTLLHLLYQETTWNYKISLWIIKAQDCVVNVDLKDWIFKMSISLILATSKLFLGLYITALNSPSPLSLSLKESDNTWFRGARTGWLPELKVRWAAASN